MGSKKQLIMVLLLGCMSAGLARPQEEVVSDEIADAAAAAITKQNQQQEKNVRDARQALEAATNTLQNNLIEALTSLANASAVAGQNVSRAAAVMIRGLVTNTVSLGGVVAYMPRLIFLDGPTQFIETLRLIRSNQIKLPNDMSTAIDTLLAFAGQVRDSGVGANFSPLVTFFPNIFAGVGDFLTTFIDSLFSFIAPPPAN